MNPCQVEALRRKELEMVVDLREQLEQKKESEEREESALRSMEAQQRLLQEAEVNIISNLDLILPLFSSCLVYPTLPFVDSCRGIQNST